MMGTIINFDARLPNSIENIFHLKSELIHNCNSSSNFISWSVTGKLFSLQEKVKITEKVKLTEKDKLTEKQVHVFEMLQC